MKAFEILMNDVSSVDEKKIVEKMKNFDWKYEFSDNTSRLRRGQQELQLIENMVYQLWKKNPSGAVRIWNENAPGCHDKTATPSFIFRLDAQDR
jgi:hypothetical protein